MRLYRVEAAGAVRHAGSRGDAVQARTALVDALGVKKSAVVIDQVEVPTNKPDLIGYLNQLATDVRAHVLGDEFASRAPTPMKGG